MTREIRTTCRVGPDGRIVVPVGVAEAGNEVDVTIAPPLRFGADGGIEALSAREGTSDAEVAVSPLDVPALLADPSRWDELVTTTGDTALTATLRDLATTLPWFVERGLAAAEVLLSVLLRLLVELGRTFACLLAQTSQSRPH